VFYKVTHKQNWKKDLDLIAFTRSYTQEKIRLCITYFSL
jgi:hypothetical protein